MTTSDTNTDIAVTLRGVFRNIIGDEDARDYYGGLKQCVTLLLAEADLSLDDLDDREIVTAERIGLPACKICGEPGHSACNPNATEATNDVVTEARAHIARLKADMRGVDTGCTNSYDTSLLGSLCAEIERLTKALTLLAHNVECFKKTPIEDFMPSLEAVLVVANLPPHKCEVCNA